MMWVLLGGDERRMMPPCTGATLPEKDAVAEKVTRMTTLTILAETNADAMVVSACMVSTPHIVNVGACIGLVKSANNGAARRLDARQRRR